MTKETQGDHWVASEYNAQGLRSRIQSSLGADVAVERNVMGDVTSVESREDGGGQCTTLFARDRMGLELARDLPGGVRSTWQRDELRRPIRHHVETNQELKGARLRSVAYLWDVSDRLSRVVNDLTGAVDYGHDAVGNLAWAQYADGSRELRAPDAVGNLFRTEDRNDRRYGPAGQLLEAHTASGSFRYKYDPEGNLSEKIELTPSEHELVWCYHWHADGMLQKVTRPDGSEVTFEYDALGRRVRKHYRGQTTHFVWDGNVPLHEWVDGELQPLPEPEVAPIWSADAEIKRRQAELSEHLSQAPPARGSAKEPITWLFEPETFTPIARLQGGTSQSILSDHLGTPTLMVDDGDAIWSADISTWGDLRNEDTFGEPKVSSNKISLAHPTAGSCSKTT